MLCDEVDIKMSNNNSKKVKCLFSLLIPSLLLIEVSEEHVIHK